MLQRRASADCTIEHNPNKIEHMRRTGPHILVCMSEWSTHTGLSVQAGLSVIKKNLGKPTGTGNSLKHSMPLPLSMNMAPINLAEPCGYVHYLHQLNWSILKPVKECKVFDRDAEVDSVEEYMPLTKAQLKTPVLMAEPCPTCGCSPPIKLMLDVHREGLASAATVELKGPNVTVGQVLRAIYKFYNLKKLTHADHSKISSMEPDSYGYRDAVLRAHAEGRGSEARWRDMMGGCVHFEGLHKEAANTFSIFLGS